MSRFPFVPNQILRRNLDNTFELIVELLVLTDNLSQPAKAELVSGLRKTIIIHTASIVEALLLWKLEDLANSSSIELSDESKYYDVKVLDSCSDYEVVGAKRKSIEKDLGDLNMLRIIDYCYKYKLIDSNLKKKLHRIRELRNQLHIGSLKRVDNEYSKSDLEFVFSVASKVKALCQAG